MNWRYFVLLVILLIAGCLETSRPERKTSLAIVAPVAEDTVTEKREHVISMFGNEFPPLEFSKRKLQQANKMISIHEKAYERYPDSLQIIMNYARALDQIGNRNHSGEIYAEGISKYPESAILHEYNGLNRLILRDFKGAIRDLEMAVLLNRGTEVSDDPYHDLSFGEGSRQYFSWYYLGLAFYFNRNYDSAISSFRKCLELETTDDLIIMPYYWLYIIYQEIGNPKVAESFMKMIDTKMTIDKSKEYYRGLLLFKGLFRPGRLMQFTVDNEDNIVSPVQAYALAIWYRLNARPEDARELINQVIGTNRWNDFGYIAAEVDSYYAVNNLN